VKEAVDVVLDLLARFLYSRMHLQAQHKRYLYDPNASEEDLHQDLYDYLTSGELAGYVQMEVNNVAGGRADLQINCGPFHLYLELKADGSRVEPADKPAYIQQTVSYAGADVRISFLVVLRLATPDETGAPQHLQELVTHTTVVIGDGSEPRHVVMVELPGNRTRPSRLK
jgi:hypothetical protein